VENRESESRVRTILKKSGANLDAVDFFRVPTDRDGCATRAPSACEMKREKLPTTISYLMVGQNTRIIKEMRSLPRK